MRYRLTTIVTVVTRLALPRAGGPGRQAAPLPNSIPAIAPQAPNELLVRRLAQPAAEYEALTPLFGPQIAILIVPINLCDLDLHSRRGLAPSSITPSSTENRTGSAAGW